MQGFRCFTRTTLGIARKLVWTRFSWLRRRAQMQARPTLKHPCIDFFIRWLRAKYHARNAQHATLDMLDHAHPKLTVMLDRQG